MVKFCQKCDYLLPMGADQCKRCGYPVQDGQSAIDLRASNSENPSVPPAQSPQLPQAVPQKPQQTPFQLPTQVANIEQRMKTLGNLIRQYTVPNQSGPFSFLYRIRCPFCNFKFHPSDCAIYGLNLQGQHVLLHAAPPEPIQRFFERFRTQSLTGEYAQKDARRLCPRCQKLLPNRYGIDPSFTIAVIGDTASGKSHFITALFHQLSERSIVQQGNIIAHFSALTRETELIFQENEERLFIERKTLQRTSNHPRPQEEQFVLWEPLIFRLRIGYTVNNQFTDNLINLIFYDIAGEDIIQDKTQNLTWPISQAQGIIHVVDPLSLPGLLPHLPSSREIEDAKKLLPYRIKADEILANVIFSFLEINKQIQQASVSTPTAIMLSKSDLLDEVVSQNKFSSRFLQYPIYKGSIDMKEVDQINQEVKSLLLHFGERALVNESQRYQRMRFFAASATGCAPDQNYTFPELKPRRCLDPLLWLLWELSGTKQ